MMTPQQRALVTATIPLLETGGEALTTHFYKVLLRDYPQVRPLFNEANQASGAQPRALAAGILMYAKHIDRLDQLGGLVDRIVNKHVALQILPEHYPMVGAALLRSIREVLGPDVATDAIIDAWAAAYGQLAEILTGVEEKIYAAKADAAGGWRGARRFKVARRVRESEEITSFYLVPEDGGALLPFLPGQYIGLRVVIDGVEARRNYSLSAAPNGREYRISVKRQAGGLVSNYLHDRVACADVLELYPPSGEFTLCESQRPLVLISGGVGITPTLAMLEAALASGRPIHFIHCARNDSVHAFRPWLEDLIAHNTQVKRFYCYSEPADGGLRPDAVGQLTRDQLAAWLPAGNADVDAYFLGPKPFMSAVQHHLKALGVPDAQSHYEFFGPASALD